MSNRFRFESQKTMLKEKGYFMMDDGTKSTDHKGKRVVKTVEEENDESESSEQEEVAVVKPKKLRSAYQFFMADYTKALQAKKLSAPEAMKEAAAAWGKADEAEKAKYVKMAEADVKR